MKAARSEDKARQAIADLKASTGKDNIEYLHLNLGDLKSIQSSAKEFQEREQKLHVVCRSSTLSKFLTKLNLVLALPQCRCHVPVCLASGVFFMMLKR